MKDNQAKYPQLRFKGFTDPWEQRKLGKMGYTFTGLSGKTKEDFGHGNAKFVTYMNVFSSPVSNSEMVENVEVDSKQHQVEYGDVFFTTSSETPQEVGMSSVWLETAENIYLNSFCFGYHPMVEFDPYYLAFMLRSPVIRKKFMLLAQGISRYNISKNKVMEMLVPVPEIVEQQKIGSFFKQLDDTITLHQRKLAMLKELKQGYLQKLFPKNGSKFPQLRFAGFDDAWEERKFKDNIVSIQTGTNLLGSAVNEGTPLIKMGNLQRGYFSFKKLEYLDSNSNVGSEDIVNYGDFLFNTRNTLELVGKGATWTGISGKYAFNSNIARFKFDGIDTIFFNYLYNTQQVISQVHARAVGTTSVSAVYPRDLNSLLYYLPSIEEQKKIGSFFKHLDDIIALHQRKLEKLQELKKGYLQKMFC